MATQSTAFAHARSPMASVASAERRREPRFGAEGDVTVVINEAGHDREIQAKLMDFSLHGLRVEIPYELAEGSEVHVYFSWGEVTTHVMRTAQTPNGFEVGLQLF